MHCVFWYINTSISTVWFFIEITIVPRTQHVTTVIVPVRAIEPNPNRSTMGLYTWLQKQLAIGADRDYSSGAHNHKQGPNPESTCTVLPPIIFHFNHWHCVFMLDASPKPVQSPQPRRIDGVVKLNLFHKHNTLTVMVMHAKDLVSITLKTLLMRPIISLLFVNYYC